MFRRIARLFVIKNRFEACAVIYALALGACDRGLRYTELYPGIAGYVLFAACTLAVFMAGAKIFDATRPRWDGIERRDPGGDRRPAPLHVR